MRILPLQGSSGRVVKNLKQRPNHRQAMIGARRRRMFLEQLEQRSLLATLTWDGSSNNLWSNPANWAGDVAPTAGDDLVFPAGAGALVNTNDLAAGTKFNTILIQGSGYNITGAAIELNGGLTANNATGNNTFGLETTLLNAQSIMSANAGTTLTYSGNIHTGLLIGTSQIFGTSSALIFDGAGTTNVTGVIGGSASLWKLGNGALVLSGANTYQGITDVRQGTVVVNNNLGLGSATAGETQIQPGAALHIQGGRTIGESIGLREGGVGFGIGTDTSTLGGLRSTGGLNTITGNVELLGGNNLIGADAGSTLIISGSVGSPVSIAPPGNRLIKVGDGTLQLAGTADNVFRGDTVVLKGTLELNKTAGRDAIGGNLVIGDNLGGDNGAAVRLLQSNQIPHLNFFDVALNTITLNSSALFDFAGNTDTVGNLTLTTGTTYSADIDLNGGTLIFGGSALTLNGFQGSSGATPAATIQDGTFNLGPIFSGAGGGLTKTFTINDSQLANIATDLNISANITGAPDVSITRTGFGTLQFSGNNTYQGPLIFTSANAAGTMVMEVGSNSAFGTGLISLQTGNANALPTFKAVGGARTISTPLSIDANFATLGSDNLTFSGPATITGAAAGSRAILVMDPAQTVTFSGVIGEGVFGSQSLVKGGRGTLSLEGANTYSGTTSISNDGGTLVLRGGGSILNTSNVTVGIGGVFAIDNDTALPGGANLTDRVNDATTITLNGKLLFSSDSAGNSSEYVGPIAPQANVGSTIELQKNSAATFTSAFTTNALSIGNDRTVSFIGTGAPLSDSALPGANRFSSANNPGALTNGIVPMGVVLGPAGAVDFATYGSSPEGFAVIPLPASAYVTDINLAGPTSNVRLSADAALTASKSVHALLLDPNVDLTGAGATLTVNATSGRIVLANNSSIAATNLAAGPGLISVPSGTATISSNIFSGNVQKGGRGALVLTGDSQTGGGFNINEGILEVQTTGGLGSPAGGTTVRQGATLQFNDNFAMGVEPITITGAGFSPNAPGSGLDTYASATGALRQVGGNASYAGTLTLAGDATDVTGLLGGYLPSGLASTTTINVSSGSLTLTGAVAGNFELLKRGSGQLEYSGVVANSNDAATRVVEGTLLLNKEPGVNALINHVEIGSDAPGAPAAALRLGGSDQIRDDRGVRIHPSGLFDLDGNSELIATFFDLMVGPTNAADVTLGGGTLTTNVNTNVFAIGAGNPTGATITGGTLALTFYGAIGTAQQRIFQVNDGATGDDLTITSVIADGSGLQSYGIQKTGFGTLVLGGTAPNTMTGLTDVREGTLALDKPAGVAALQGSITIGLNNNVDSGFAGSDVLELRAANQIPDFLSAVLTINATGLLDLNGFNETFGQTDGQAALTMQAGSIVDLDGGQLTLIGNIVGSAANGAGLWTPVAPPRIIDGTLNLGSVARSIDSGGDRTELPYELEISANLVGTGGFFTVGTGTLLLTGDNSGLSGDIFRTNGNLAIGSDTAFGTGRVLINTGHLATYGGKRTVANRFDIVNTIGFAGGNALAGTLNLGGITGALGGGGNDLTFTGPVNLIAGTTTAIVASAAQVDFAGGLGETFGVAAFTKSGYGTAILSSFGSYSGTTTVSTNGGALILRDQGTAPNTSFTVGLGGTLQIDNRFGANLTNRVGDTAGITLSGGTLAFVGSTGGISSEAVGTLTASDNTNPQVQLLLSPQGGSNASWRFTNYTRTANAGAMVTFVGRGVDIGAETGNKLLFTTVPTLVNSILPTAVIINTTGPEFASIRNPVGGTVDPFFNALEAYTAVTAPLIGGLGTFATTLTGATATTNVKLTANQSLAADTSASAVLLAGSGITIGESAASTLTVASGLLASVGNGNALSTTGLTLTPAEGLIVNSGDLTVNSLVAGAGTTLAKNGPGLLTVGGPGANSFAGLTRVNTGIYRAAKATAFGTTAGTVNVAYGATVELTGGISIPAEAITLNGTGEGNLAAVPLRNFSGTNTWLGGVTLGNNNPRTAIDVTPGSTLNLDGVVTSNGFNKIGAGTLSLGGTASNAFGLPSVIWQGTVALNKTTGLALNNASNPSIHVGDFVGGDDSDRLINLLDNQILNDAGAANQSLVQVNASGLYDLNGRTESFGDILTAGQDNTNAFNMFAGPLYSASIDLNGGTLNLIGGTGGAARSQNIVANVLAALGGGLAGPVRIDDGTLNVTNGTNATPAIHDFNVVDGAGIEDLVITANFGGTGGLDKTNAGRLALSPSTANTFDGTTTIAGGEVVVRGTTPLGGATNGTTVGNGFSLLIDNSSSAEPLSINGIGFGGQGAIRNVGGNNTLTGTIALAGAATFGVDAGQTLNIAAAITGGAVGITKLLPGTLELSGLDMANTFTGDSTVAEGTVVLNKTTTGPAANLNAFAAGILNVGNNSGGQSADEVRYANSDQLAAAVRLIVFAEARVNTNGNNETMGGGGSPNYATHVVDGTTQSGRIDTGSGTWTVDGAGTGTIEIVSTAAASALFTTASPSAVISGNLNLLGPTDFRIDDSGLSINELEVQAVITTAVASVLRKEVDGANGGGTLLLSGNNAATLLGGVTVGTVVAGANQIGTLAIGHNNALGGGTLTFVGNIQPVLRAENGARTITTPISLQRDVTILGDDNLTLGAITNSGGNRVVTVNMNGPNTLTLGGTINLSNDATGRILTVNNNTFGGGVTNGVTGGDVTVSGQIVNGGAGAGGFTKGGVGLLTLTNDTNSYTGTTLVAAGNMRVTEDGALGGKVAEQQTFGVTSTGGGTFTITYLTATAALPFVGTVPPTATDVENALNALPALARTGGLVTVTSSNPAGPTTTYTITFGGTLEGVDVTPVTVAVAGNVTLSTAVATPVGGSGFTTVAFNAATLQVVGGLNMTEPLDLGSNGIANNHAQGFGNFGALRLVNLNPAVTETATWSVPMRFGNTTGASQGWFGIDGGGANPDRLVLNGALGSASGSTLVKVSAGELEIGGATDNAQATWNGVSAIDDGIDLREGTMYLSKPLVGAINYTAIVGNGTVTVGDGGGGANVDRMILNGTSQDQLGGANNLPVVVGASGHLSLDGGMVNEVLRTTLTLQRLGNLAGIVDSSPTRTITLGGTVAVTNAGITTGATPAALIMGNLALGGTRAFDINDSYALDPAEDLEVSAIVSGATFGITKGLAGTMSLTSGNTYTGTTTINSQTLDFNSAFNNGSNVVVLGTLIARGAGTLGTGAVTLGAGGTLVLDNSAASANRIGDAAVVTLGGANLTLIGNAGGTNETVGTFTLNVGNDAGQANRVSVDSSAGGLTVLQTTSLTRGASGSADFFGVGADLGNTTNSRIQITGGTNPFVNTVLPWATVTGPAGFDLITDADGNAGAAPYFLGRVPLYSSNINAGSGIVRLTGGTHTLTADRSVDALLLEGGATINGPFTLSIGTGTTPGLVVTQTGSNTIATAGNGATPGVQFTTREPLFLTDGASSLTVSGNINASGAVRKERNGTLILSGDNDIAAGRQLTGTININAGRLVAASDDALGITGLATVQRRAALVFDTTAGNVTIGNKPLTVNGFGLNDDGSGALRTIGANTASLGTGATVVTFATNPTIVSVDAGAILSLNANVSGTNPVIKRGGGELVYAGGTTNASTGALSINEGTLTLNKTGAAIGLQGSTTIDDLGIFDSIGGGTLRYAAAATGTDQIGGVALTVNYPGVFEINGKTDTIGLLTVAGGTYQNTPGGGAFQVTGLTTSGGTINTGSGALNLAGTLTYNSGLTATNGTATIAGNLDLVGAQRTFTINDGYALNEVIIDAMISNGRLLKNGAGGLLLNNSGNTFLAGVNEVQRIVIGGTPTAGTSQFNINFNGNTTATITVDAVDANTAAAIDAALEALPNVGPGGVSVTVFAALTFDITFTAHLGQQDVPNAITATSVTAPGTYTISTPTGGVAGVFHTAGILSFSNNTALGTAFVQLSNSQLLPMGGNRTIANQLVLNNNVTLTFGGRRDFGGTDDLTVTGGVTLHSSVGTGQVVNLDVIDNQTLVTFAGVISGGGNFIVPTKRNIGTMVWSGNNTFDTRTAVSASSLTSNDGIRLEGGILRLAHSNALGDPTQLASISVRGDAGAVLELDGTTPNGNIILTGRVLDIAGADNGTARGFLNRTSTAAVFTGIFRSLGGNNQVIAPAAIPQVRLRHQNDNGNDTNMFWSVDAGSLDINAAIVGLENDATPTADTGRSILKTGGGTLRYSGSGQNNIVGTTAIFNGTLELNKTPDVLEAGLAIAGPLQVGDNVTPGTVVWLNNEQIVLNVAISVASNGALNLNNFADNTSVTTTLTVGETTSSQVLTGATGNWVHRGDVAVVLRPGVTAAAPPALISGHVQLTTTAAASRTYTVNDGPGAVELLVNANFTEGATVGGLIKAGAGRLAMTSPDASTFTGNVAVNAGVLQIHGDNDLGTNAGTTTVASGAALELTGGFTETGEALTVAGSGILNGATTHVFNFANQNVLGTGALRNVGGDNVWQGNVTLNSNPVNVAVDAGSLTLSGTSVLVYGANGLIKTGVGPLELGGTAANTGTGSTSVNQGTLILNKAAAVAAIPGGTLFVGDGIGGDNSDVVRYATTAGTNQINDISVRIASTGLLDLNGISDSITPPDNQQFTLDVGRTASGTVTTGAGTLTLPNGTNKNITVGSLGDATITSPAAEISGNLSFNAVTRQVDVKEGPAPVELLISAVIANGAGGLTKANRGTLELTGNNTYTGTTTVNPDSGTLLASTPATVAASTYNIGAGSTLAGTGTITGPVNFLAVGSNLTVGGILNPGPTAPAPGNTGILTVNNNVSFAAGSIYLADINGTTAGTQYDQLVVGGTGTVTITGVAGPTPNNTAMINGTTGMGFQPVNGVDSFKLINTTSPNLIAGPPLGSFLSQVLPQPPLTSPATVLIGGKTYATTYNVAAGLNDGNDFVLQSVATIRVWDGEGNQLALPNNNWSWGPNWVGDFAPFSGDSVLFGNQGNTRESNNNDFMGYSLGAITFDKSAGAAYTLNGNAVTLNGPLPNNGITQTGATVTNNVVNLAGITLATNPQNITNGSVSGLLTINSPINGAQTLNLAGLGDLTFTGAIGGGTPLTSIVATGVDDLTFSSTIATTGNVTQTAGTGLTTLSGGNVGGALAITTEAITLAGSTLTVVGAAALTATVGNIADGNAAANNLTAPSLTATAVTGIDLDTTIVDLTATNTGAGNVTIDEVNGLNLLGLSVANGNAVINAGGALTDGATAITSVSGNGSFSGTTITLGEAGGDLFDVGTLTFASAGAVNISENSSTQLTGTNAASSLILNSAAALTNAASASLTVTNNASFSGTSIALGNQASDLIDLGSLTFTSAGAVSIAEDGVTNLAGTSTADSLVLSATGITNNAASSITVTNNATLTAQGITLGSAAGDTVNFGTVTFTTTVGGIDLTEDSSIDLLGANLAAGPVILTSPDQAAAGQNITLPLGSSVTSTLSFITLTAGDNVTLAGNVSAATTLNVDVDDLAFDVGTGGVVTVSGVVTTTGGAFFTGHNDNDTFTLTPQAGSAFTVSGNAPTTFPGDVLNLDLTGTVNPLLTLGGLGSGTWTFDPPLQSVVYTSIEQVNATGANYNLILDTNTGGFGNTGVDDQILLRRSGADFVIERTGLPIAPDNDDVGIIFQGAMAAILSFRYVGSNDNDIVTVSDAGGMFDFTSSVPGVPNNPNLAGAAEFSMNGGGGSDQLVFDLTGASVAQTYAIGNGSGAPGAEGEIETISGGVTLLSYFQNVELARRISSGATPGVLSVIGDLSPNTMSVVASGTATQVTATGYTPFEFTGNNYSGVSVSGGQGTDTLSLVSIGSSQTNPLATTLNGDAAVDTIRVQSTSGNTGIVTLNGGAGSDQFQLYNTLNTVDAIVGQVVVDGTDGNVGGNNDTLTIIDTGDLSGDNVLVEALNPGVNSDYRIEGINATAGNDVVFRNIDTLDYTGTQGNDTIDGRFESTVPVQDLSVVTLSGWLGADQFLLFTSDQAGGSGAGVTPNGMASGVAIVNLYGDFPGNPNLGDGNDIFGETPPGLVGTGSNNVGLVVPDTVRGIRPSASTAINIDGGQPTGPVAPTMDTIGDVFNVDISDLGGSSLILPTVSGVLAAAGLQPLAYTQIEDINVVYNHELINVQMGDTLVIGTSGVDLIQFMRAQTPANPNLVRIRVNTQVVDLTLTGKTLTFAGASNDFVTQANVDLPAEMYGEDGDDYISGAMANDYLVGGLGSDQINASGGDNVVWGDNAPSTLVPVPQDLAIGGDDFLSALGGNDVFYGGGGNDQVSAGGGNDYANGGQGDDILGGNDGDDRLYGGSGNDVIGGGAGNDLVSGGAGNDNIRGDSGADVIFGGTGTDDIAGDGGNDIVITGSVANENSSFTSVQSVGNYSAATYTNPTDNDAALLTLLNQWSQFGNRMSLAAITHDGVNDNVYGGLNDDDFCWEAADIADDFPATAPPDYNAIGMGLDERFGPT